MDTIEIDGLTFRVTLEADQDAGEPWNNVDTLGSVSIWTSRPKASGERVLNSDRRGHKRFYDYAAAVRNARREGLTEPQAVEAADREFDWLRAWCDDRWSYVGVIVTLLDVEGNATDISDAIWGVEDDGDCASVCADDLARGLHTVYGHLDELTTTVRIREAA